MCKSQNPLYRYQLSVLADKEKIILKYYQYWPIQIFNLLVIIGIGQYEKLIINNTQWRQSGLKRGVARSK